MTTQVMHEGAVVQERRLVTAIPGPVSQRLQARKVSAVPSGVGTTLPVYVTAAAGGVVVDADGNSLIDFGSGIAVTTVGNSAPAVVDAVTAQVQAFTHTCFMVTPYEGYVEVAEALNRLTPGDHDKRTALFNSGSEAVENAVKIARSHTGRQAVVVFEHAYHGRTNLTMAMTAKNKPYKSGFGPFAQRSTVPRCPTRSATVTSTDQPRRPVRSPSSKSRSARRTLPLWSSSPSRARADSSFPLQVSYPRSRRGAAPRAWCSSLTKCRPDSPAPGRCSRAITKASSPI